jgi:hypothetical protein
MHHSWHTDMKRDRDTSLPVTCLADDEVIIYCVDRDDVNWDQYIKPPYRKRERNQDAKKRYEKVPGVALT